MYARSNIRFDINRIVPRSVSQRFRSRAPFLVASTSKALKFKHLWPILALNSECKLNTWLRPVVTGDSVAPALVGFCSPGAFCLPVNGFWGSRTAGGTIRY